MPETNTNLRAGERVGNYQILAMAGAGGMGVVYKALDLKLERTVALKFLPADLNASEKDKERFLKEARTASSLDHPNIGVIHGVEEAGDRAFIVMAFYEGESLTQKIRRGPLNFREAVDIAIQMARGLEAAHARNVVHRDVKPSNVLLTQHGLAKIVDFGLARVVTSASMTQTGGTSGTVGYMSPEQSLGKPVDARTDIWALGVVLAEMLSGENPFWRDNVPATVVAILNDPPRPMEKVPPELQQIVYRALSKDPAYRYQSCAELRKDLEVVRDSLTPESTVDLSAPTVSLKSAQFQKYLSHASQSAWVPAATRKPGTGRWWLVAGIGITLCVVIGLLFVPYLRSRLSRGLLTPAEEHIAVLPFDNIGNNPANEPLAEGLMDSLTGKLSELDVGGKSLWVVPSSEVRRSKIADPGAALRQWGANVVVKGSISRDGQDVQLTVNLIDTKDLRQIGSATLEDRAGDLATLQDEAVAKLAKLMNINVTAEMLRATGGSVVPAAYESYLKALGYVLRYDTPGNLDRAITALENAVKSDPRFALGFAELGEAYRLKNAVDPNPKWIEEASANCSHALQLDDRLPAAYVTLGRVHAGTGKFDLGLQEYQHALQLDPHNADALMGTADVYERMGRVAEAEAAYKKGVALRPDFWDGYNTLGNFYNRQRKYAEAITEFEHAAQLTPDNAVVYINLGAAHLNRGDATDLPQAEAALKKSIELGPSYPAYSNLAFLYQSEKRYADSVAMSQKALQLNDQNYLVWANLMAAYMALDQKENAKPAREHAISLLEQKVRLEPQEALTQVSLATLYAQEGLRDKALTRVQAALARSPDDPDVLELAGETYENLGDRPRALEYIERAVQKGYSLDGLKDSPDLQNLLTDPNFRPNAKKPNH